MLLLTLACVLIGDDDLAERQDLDNDGSPYPEDCDSRDGAVFPGADEVCDGIDQDCDGRVDEDAGDLWYEDDDGDGLGAEDETTTACQQPDGYVDNADDCDDGDDTRRGPVDWYRDQDDDGWGVDDDVVSACEPPEGYVRNAGDCDDTDVALHPDTVWYTDGDGDGYGTDPTTVDCAPGDGWALQSGDCDDTTDAANPAVAEKPNDGLDNDCDGTWSRLDGAITQTAGRFEGNTGADAGDSVASVGDLDGDGHADFMMGAYNDPVYSEGGGAAYLFYGPVTAGPQAADDSAGWKLVGDADQGIGSAVGGGVDLTGDGTSDVVVSAIFASDIRGQIYLFNGAQAGTGTVSSAVWTMTGSVDGDGLGNRLDWMDQDGDGRFDVLAGANGAFSNRGGAYVFHGPLSGDQGVLDAQLAIIGPSSGSQFGECVANADDLDGDGLDDVLIGAPGVDGESTNVGVAYVFLGGASGLTPAADADYRLVAESAGALAGWEVGPAGDTNQDGTLDFYVSAPGHSTDQGAVYLVSDLSNALTFLEDGSRVLEGDSNGDFFGSSVAATDLDGDGVTDLAVGATGVNARRGRVYVFYGPMSAADADAWLPGLAVNEPVGHRVVAVGDVQGDGRAGLVVGVPTLNDAHGAAVLLLADGL